MSKAADRSKYVGGSGTLVMITFVCFDILEFINLYEVCNLILSNMLIIVNHMHLLNDK